MKNLNDFKHRLRNGIAKRRKWLLLIVYVFYIIKHSYETKYFKEIYALLKERKVNKIRTESGVWIPASYKSNRYTSWKEKSKVDATNDDDSEEEPSQMQKCM